MEDIKLNLMIIALCYYQTQMKDLFENQHGHVLVLDEKKAQLLASLILSGSYDEATAEDILGIPKSLYRQIRKHFLN